MSFRNYGLPKTRLDQCVKCPFSEDPSKSNILNAPKHCSNLKDSPFTIFNNDWSENCLIKSPC